MAIIITIECDGKKEDMNFLNMDAAQAAFEKMCGEFPDVVVISGIPRPHFRESSKGTILLHSEDGPIEMSSDGVFYLGAALQEDGYLQNGGYMRVDPIWEKIWDVAPPDAIRGHYYTGGVYDPIQIAGLEVA